MRGRGGVVLHTRELFDSMTMRAGPGSEELAPVVDAMQDCAAAVTACAAAMLTEDDRADLASAVSRDLDCADVVAATLAVLTRGNGPDSSLISAQVEACLVSCERSHELCRQHAHHHTHCRICSDATRRCAEACRTVLRALHR
jgi:hypothetical protein